MMQAKPFKLDRDLVETAVHVIDIDNALGRPEPLSYGSRARPDARIDCVCVELFPPHGNLAAEDELALFRSKRRTRRQRIDEVVLPCRLHPVKIVPSRKQPLI